MIVNVSQSPYLFDETLQVLKFSAIASKVHIEMIKEPKPMEFKKPMEEKAKKRKTVSDLPNQILHIIVIRNFLKQYYYFFLAEIFHNGGK